MNVNTAERALAREIARLGELELDRSVRCGGADATDTAPLVKVRFVSGKMAGDALAEFVAGVYGVFAEPEEARNFAAAVWGGLPRYGTDGFTELAAEGPVEFAEKNGFFTVAGCVKACFA